MLVSGAGFPLPKTLLLLGLLFSMLLWLPWCGWVGCVCSPELPLAASPAAPCTGGSRQALPPWLAAPGMICGGAGSNVAWREHCFPAAHADLCK